MSSEHMQMKMDLDKLRQETIPTLQNEITLLKSQISGIQLSQKALADTQEGLLEAINKLEEGGKTSVGMEALNGSLQQIVNILSQQAVAPTNSAPSTPPKQQKIPRGHSSGKKDDEAVPVDLDVADIEWMVKGNNPAGDNARFAYAFVYEQGSQTIKEELREVYAACLQLGAIETADGYTVKIGGNKNNLLNRTITKRK